MTNVYKKKNLFNDIQLDIEERELVEKLNKRGIPTDLQTFPGLGHQYPENFEVVLDKALSFIKN